MVLYQVCTCGILASMLYPWPTTPYAVITFWLDSLKYAPNVIESHIYLCSWMLSFQYKSVIRTRFFHLIGFLFHQQQPTIECYLCLLTVPWTGTPMRKRNWYTPVTIMSIIIKNVIFFQNYTKYLGAYSTHTVHSLDRRIFCKKRFATKLIAVIKFCILCQSHFQQGRTYCCYKERVPELFTTKRVKAHALWKPALLVFHQAFDAKA